METQSGLKHGIYRIHWKDGGNSLASVGYTHDGTNWFAPCNWTTDSNITPIVGSTRWDNVYMIELIEENDYKNNHSDTPASPSVREALDVPKYMRHLPISYKEQNWDEAFQAMADTPAEFRDGDYYAAIQEMEEKRKTCSCGMEAARTALAGEGEEQ